MLELTLQILRGSDLLTWDGFWLVVPGTLSEEGILGEAHEAVMGACP